MIKLHPIQKALLELAESDDINMLNLTQIGRKLRDTYGLDASHPQKVKHHKEQLIRRGMLVVRDKKLVLKREFQPNVDILISIPILGAANCGNPSMVAEEDLQGYLKISKNLLKHKNSLIAIRAIGDSMNKASIDGDSIEDGDYLIVDSDYPSPKDGDFVLSVIDGVANVKKMQIDKKRKQVILLSMSTQEYPPIYIHQDDIQTNSYLVNGKVLKVVKSK